MKIAYICSNYIPVSKNSKKGTEIFNYNFLNGLAFVAPRKNLQVAAFASGDSKLPFEIISVEENASSADKTMPEGKHIVFELALLSKAFSMENQFDLFHINIGDGDIAVPFSPFVKKPILITIHHLFDAQYVKRYFSLFGKNKNIFFISISNFQRKLLPQDLNYAATIYHGVDTGRFAFNEDGGNSIMWAGRAIPEKGPGVVVEVAVKTKHEANLFGIYRKEHELWMQKNIFEKINANSSIPIHFELGKRRDALIEYYKNSKLFLFPIACEESFGLVLTEAMSCGTPVVAYAKGSIPEIIKDGETGFIVNESDNDIRGNWIIKKTGFEGLIEAVEIIYNLPRDKYLTMRKAARQRVEEKFTIGKMIDNYIDVYKKIGLTGK